MGWKCDNFQIMQLIWTKYYQWLTSTWPHAGLMFEIGVEAWHLNITEIQRDPIPRPSWWFADSCYAAAARNRPGHYETWRWVNLVTVWRCSCNSPISSVAQYIRTRSSASIWRILQAVFCRSHCHCHTDWREPSFVPTSQLPVLIAIQIPISLTNALNLNQNAQ